MKLLEENARLKEMAAEAQRLKEELERVMQAIDGRATAGTARSSMESVKSPHRATAGTARSSTDSVKSPRKKSAKFKATESPRETDPAKCSWYV